MPSSRSLKKEAQEAHALILPLPHSYPQLRTSRTLLDSWVWLGATEGGLVAAGGMRLKPLGGQPLGFGYLFASHPLFDDAFG